MATNLAITGKGFSKCAPNLSTNIKTCGSVTICNAKPLTDDELQSVYMKSTDYRVMEALLHHDMEIRMCEAQQDGLYEFMMANKVSLTHKLGVDKLNSGLIKVRPFILMRQYSPINNEWWKGSGGVASGNNIIVNVQSTTNIPADVRSFPARDNSGKAGIRVHIESLSAGGSKVVTQWEVTHAADNGNGTLALTLAPQNAASYLDLAKLDTTNLTNGTAFLLKRGTPNVNAYEKYCNEMPAYLNWKNVPSWIEETRDSICWSEQYDQWRNLMLENNPLFREFGDLDEIAKNKQLMHDWQKRFVNQIFYGKALPHQTTGDYDLLDQIPAYSGLNDAGIDIGVGGATCVGVRANAVGIYEQLAQCGRVFDAQGGQLNLPALFVELYNMMRVREANGTKNAKVFDLFTDSIYAELINRAMIAYYIDKSQGTLRLTKSIDYPPRSIKEANFGFMYESYKLFWPAGVVINVITHNFFDDYLTAGATVSSAQQNASRVVWVLDFTGIYPGIIASERVTHKTGDIRKLAEINPNFACVMRANTQQQTLISVTYTVIVECPASNLLIENLSNTVPEAIVIGANAYPGIHTSTSTTTQSPYVG